MNAKTQTIPEADDIAQLTKEEAAQVFLARVEVLSSGGVQYPTSFAQKLWPILAAQSGLKNQQP